MEALLDSIRIAVSDGASDDERRRGAEACLALAEALDGLVAVEVPPTISDEPITLVEDEPITPTTAVPAAPVIATPFTGNPFVGMSADQILELAIARLRAATTDGAGTGPAGMPFRITLVPVPRLP